MRDAGRLLIVVVRDHDEGDVGIGTIVLDDGCGTQAPFVVETVEGFVEDEEVGRFDESSRQEAEALFAAAHVQEHPVGQMLNAENAHPGEAGLPLLGPWTYIQPYTIVQPTGYDIYGRQVALVGSVHLRADISDMAFDVPNALARSTSPSEQFYVAGISLGIVGTDEAQERGLARAVGP